MKVDGLVTLYPFSRLMRPAHVGTTGSSTRSELRPVVVLMATLAAICCIGGCASPPVQSLDPDASHYACASGAEVVITPVASDHIRLTYEDQSAEMRPLPAASGARYASLDERLGWRWHSKGSEGILSYMAPDDSAYPVPIERVCILSD